jgi:rifampicin phosphotransferase
MSEKYYVTDSELSVRFPLYTRANVGEVFPEPVTPLTGSGIMFHSEIAWREAWERIGAFQMDEFPPDEMAQLGIVGGYCYLNASLIRLFGERAPGLTWKDMDEQFFGAQPGIPPYVAVDGDEDLVATKKTGDTFGWALSLTKIDELDELTADRNDTRQLRADRPDYAAMASAILRAPHLHHVHGNRARRHHQCCRYGGRPPRSVHADHRRYWPGRFC